MGDNVQFDKANEIFTVSNQKFPNDESTEKANMKYPEEFATFESAIEATGFGKYNWMLLIIAFPAALSSQFDTSSMSYVMPIAQCDLNLSLDNKGLLNAITYSGMVSGAFIWGYLADTIGRKKLLICGYFLDGFFAVLGGFSMHYTTLLVAKFLAGFVINGPLAALMSYLSEFHCAKYRTPIPLLIGIIHSTGSILLPLLGWLIFTENVNVTIFDDLVVIRSWNVYLFVCALPSLISGIAFLLLPESPKFLMTTGKNQEAYEVFQTVYSWNTGMPKNSYPIRSLIDEISQQEKDDNKHGGRITAGRTKIQALREGWLQITPLFFPPYIGKILVVFAVQFALVLGLNSLRLWIPQIFTAMNDYHALHPSDKEADVCQVLEMIINTNKTQIEDECFVNYDNASVYINNIILSFSTAMMYLISVVIISKIGRTPTLIGAGVIAGTSVLSLYFSKNEAALVVLTSLYTGLSGVVCNLVISIVVDLFPTTLRTMTINLTMTSGRVGAVVGNLIFPFLLSSSCLTPFLTISSLTLGGTLLTALLPKTDKKALQ